MTSQPALGRIRRLAVLALMATGFMLPLRAAQFKAGVARVDITPATPEPLYGYMNRTARATGTLDPLFARVLVLEAGGKRLALVTLDLGRVFGAVSLERLRDAARKQGIPHLIMTASHTHAGPNILDEYPHGRIPEWEKQALEKVAAALAEAREHLVSVRLGTGYGVTYIGYNRRRINPDGSVTMFWRNDTKVSTAPVDPTVGVLRLDTLDGNPLAILVNYACHPVIFGPDNLEYSADYVGVMCKTVEAGIAGRLLCLFFQGADGDINPYYATTPRAEGAVTRRDWTGQHLGEEAARVAKSIKTQATADVSCDFAEEELTFQVRWDPERFRAGLLQSYGPRVFEDHAELLQNEPVPHQLNLSVTGLLLNRRIAFMSMPGEPFVQFQMNWRDRCPVRDCFFIGYANGYFDYFPTLQAATQGGYGAADSNTYVEVGAGERMVDAGLTLIYRMLGQLTSLPENTRK